MGINISGKYVQLDHTHQKRVDTSLESNPTCSKCHGVVVDHVFRRNKTGDLDNDGNPLIYALKGMKGYKIMPVYRKELDQISRQILAGCQHLHGCDFLLPMPSSNTFCAEFAQLVGEVTNTRLLSNGFLRKKTIAEMLDRYGSTIPSGLNEARAGEYKQQLAAWRKMKPGQLVAVKDIKNKIRRCFDPFVISEGPDLTGKRVIIVDDVLSSGASLSSLIQLLPKATGCEIPRAASFLSSL